MVYTINEKTHYFITSKRTSTSMKQTVYDNNCVYKPPIPLLEMDTHTDNGKHMPSWTGQRPLV